MLAVHWLDEPARHPDVEQWLHAVQLGRCRPIQRLGDSWLAEKHRRVDNDHRTDSVWFGQCKLHRDERAIRVGDESGALDVQCVEQRFEIVGVELNAMGGTTAWRR